VSLAAGGSESAIEVAGVRKAYGGRVVLEDVSFDVKRGEILALLGPNGAGKTTTVEMIEGYRRPDAGSVRVLGIDPGRADRSHRARVGLMLQGGAGIDPRMTPREVVALYGRFHTTPRDVDELLAAVGLHSPTTRARYRRLSGGERQGVGLALALVGRPDVAILDEPTSGMDVEARRSARDLLSSLRDEGVTALLTSHDLAEVERVADRIAILDRGRLVALGTPDELTGAAARLVRFRLATALSGTDVTALGGRVGIAIEDDGGPGRYRFASGAGDPAVVAALTSWCAERGARIVELRTGGGSLEERYLELTRATTPSDTA